MTWYEYLIGSIFILLDVLLGFGIGYFWAIHKSNKGGAKK